MGWLRYYNQLMEFFIVQFEFSRKTILTLNHLFTSWFDSVYYDLQLVQCLFFWPLKSKSLQQCMQKETLKLFPLYSAKSEISKVYGLCSDYYDGPNSKLLVWGRQFWGLHQNDDYYLTTYYYTRRATLSQSDWENQGIYIISICDVNPLFSDLALGGHTKMGIRENRTTETRGSQGHSV